MPGAPRQIFPESKRVNDNTSAETLRHLHRTLRGQEAPLHAIGDVRVEAHLHFPRRRSTFQLSILESHLRLWI